MATDSAVHLDHGNRWSSFKHIDKVVQSAICTRCSKNVGELEVILRKHKPDFLSLLKNPTRSPLHRDVVVQSVKDGITVVQQANKSKKVLPKNVVEEALLMSEMFDLNELASLELIITGESQVPRYPGAARGPVAVMLYYDAKRSLLSSLKCLLQAVSGKSWSNNLSRDFNRLLASFLKELVDGGVVDRALNCLNHFDVKTEFDLLHRNRALGPGKFKRQVYDLIKEVKELYAYITFAFAAQFDLKTETTNNIIKTLATKATLDSNGSLDSTSAMLLIGVFYALDCPNLESSPGSPSITRGDDIQHRTSANLPQIIKDKQALNNINQTIVNLQFTLPQVKTLINFCLALTVKSINIGDSNYQSITAAIDEERLMDDCISDKIFDVFDLMLVRNNVVESDEFFMLRLHGMLIDLPHLFPMKMKELRDRGDEEGRIVASNIQQGINPPASLNHYFQKYLHLLSNYYSKDKKGLSTNFWKSSESLSQGKVSENVISFSKFIKSTLETYLPQNLRLALFHLLTAFAKTSPFNIFSLLRQSGSLHNPQFSLEEIFKSFELYYKSFSVDVGPVDFGSISAINSSILNPNQQSTQRLAVTAMDVEVLCAILKLVEAMASDKTCSISIAENQAYNCITVFVGLVTCPISRKLKASLLSCLGGFCKSSPSVALNVWSKLEIIIPKPQVAVGINYLASGRQKNWTDGVHVEVEDVEPRSEEYPVTIGFLKCVNDIADHVINIRDSTKQALHQSLQVISQVIAKQNEFLNLVRSVPGYPYAALMPMSTLFSNNNPRTNEPDRLATLVKITSLTPSDIRIETMKILHGLISDEASISYLCLLQVQPFKKFHDDYILHGFVDSIESGNDELRLEVLKLLADCFQSDCSNNSSGYGLAHRLLGLDRKMQLKTPGSFDQTFTCLHSIIAAIENEPESSSNDERLWRMKILLLMCTNSSTSLNTLRFLRTSYELIANYLKYRNKLNLQEMECLFPEVPLFWKLLATELKTVSDSSLKSYSNTYIRLLLGSDGNKKLLNLIPSSVFTHNYPDMPNWEYFDSNELWNTISSCSENGVVDIKSLHRDILQEVKQFSSQLGASQAGSIQNEIRAILSFACDLNVSKSELDLKLSYNEGWRDLVETILLTDALSIFEEKTRGVLVLQLLNELLAIASSADTISTLMNPVSSIIMTATTTIRKMPSEAVSKSNILTSTQYLINVLESPSTAETWNQLKRARVNLYTSLLHLLRTLDVSNEHKLSHRLLDRLVKDSLTGVELVKVLALSVLAECDTSWVNELASDGSLRMLIDSIAGDDKEIKASQCDKLSKAYYSFEAKMTLMIRIASTQAGSRTLIHLGIVDCLINLETFEIYPNSTSNDVCFNIFASVLKLVLLLVDMSIPSDQEVLAKFLNSKSHTFYDLMRTPPDSYRKSDEGKIIVPLLVAITSKLILFTDCQLQKSFAQYVQVCHELKSDTDPQILTSVLQGCINFMSQNPLTPLFLPSWDFRNTFAVFGQPTLGLLIPVLENCVICLKKLEKDGKCTGTGNSGHDVLIRTIIESSVYVIWHHLNLFSNALELSEEESLAINHLMIKSSEFLNDSFFSAIRSVIKNNTFIDATIRRINRIVSLQTNS